MKMIYFGYDVFGNLLTDLLSEKVEITRIYTLEKDDDWNKSELVAEIARTHNIELFRGEPDKDELGLHINSNKVTYGIVAAIPYVLPIIPNFRLINFHPSHLPDGRGPWPIPSFLTTDKDKFGVAAHEVTSAVDHGPVLLSKSFPVLDEDCYETLVAKAQIGFSDLLSDFLIDPDAVWEARREQVGGSDIPFPPDSDQEITLEDDVQNARRKLRTYGRNEISVEWEGKSWLVEWASASRFVHTYKPGSVISKFHGNVVLALKDGVLVIHSYRKEV